MLEDQYVNTVFEYATGESTLFGAVGNQRPHLIFSQLASPPEISEGANMLERGGELKLTSAIKGDVGTRKPQ